MINSHRIFWDKTGVSYGDCENLSEDKKVYDWLAMSVDKNIPLEFIVTADNEIELVKITSEAKNRNFMLILN